MLIMDENVLPIIFWNVASGVALPCINSDGAAIPNFLDFAMHNFSNKNFVILNFFPELRP